jgi:hypothetical protein
MQRLSVKLQLACGERSFDELHLQNWLFWARWRHVRVRSSRTVPASSSCSDSDVLGRLSVPTVKRHKFW